MRTGYVVLIGALLLVERLTPIQGASLVVRYQSGRSGVGRGHGSSSDIVHERKPRR